MMEAWRRSSTPRLRTLAAVALIFTLFGGAGVWWLKHVDTVQRAAFLEGIERRAGHQVDQVTQEVGQRLGGLKPIANQIADGLASGALNADSVTRAMEDALREHPSVYELGLASEPRVIDPKDDLFSPSFDRKSGEIQFTPRSTYDYRDAANPDTEWYRDALEAPQAFWQEPYCDGVSCYAEYAVPLRIGDDGAAAGVVYINMHPAGLGRVLEELDLGATGYGMIVSSTGLLVSHPNTTWVYEGLSLFDLAERHRDAELEAIAKQVLSGQRGVAEHVDPISGQSSWIFFRPIPETDWSLLVVYIRDDVLRQRDAVFYSQHLIVGLTFFATLFCLAVYLGILAFPRFEYRALWGVSLTASLLLLMTIGFIWQAVLSGARDPGMDIEAIQAAVREDAESVVQDPSRSSGRLLNQAEAEAYLKDYERTAQAAGKPEPLHLKTGVFLQSLEFDNPYNVLVTGYVWQHYLDTYREVTEPGFRLPEAVDPHIELVYQRPLPDRDGDGESDGELFGWYFEALLRQTFDYSEYPFDDKSVWLRLWPMDLDSSVILTPLFDSYNLIKPSSLPGIEKDFVLAGWHLKNSYFTYRMSRYNVDFGVPESSRLDVYPELHFHVDMQRVFMNAFISNLIPLISVVLILYTVIMIITADAQRAQEHGFSTVEILGAAAALFFSVLIGHVQLRDQFQVEEVMYLEYFYFVVYLLILVVAVNGLLFHNASSRSLVRYQDNLIMKLLYWPVTLGALCLVTLWMFS